MVVVADVSLDKAVACNVEGRVFPVHYGFLTKEVEFFDTGKGVVDLSFHRVFRVSGEDRFSWLSRVSSQLFTDEGVSYSKEALILNPQGYVMFSLCVVVERDCIFLIEQRDIPDLYSASGLENSCGGLLVGDSSVACGVGVESAVTTGSVDSGVAVENACVSRETVPVVGDTPLLEGLFNTGDLALFLDRMIFSSDVCVENLTGKVQVLGLTGRVDLDVLCENLTGNGFDVLGVWSDPWPNMGVKNATYFNVEKARSFFDSLTLDDYGRVDSFIEDDEHPAHGKGLMLLVVEDVVKDLSVHSSGNAFEFMCQTFMPCGVCAFQTWCVKSYRPWGFGGVDRLLPHEVDWLRTAVALNTGCYCGQETVARIVNVGKPPRRLVKFYVDGFTQDIPPKNSGVFIVDGGEKVEVGKVLTVGLDYDEGWVALGLVRRNVSNNEQFYVGDLAASCEEIVSVSGRCTASPDVEKIRQVRKNRLL